MAENGASPDVQTSSSSPLEDAEMLEVWDRVQRANIDFNELSAQTLWKRFYQYKNNTIVDGPSKTPTPPYNNLMANDYNDFISYATAIHTQLGKIRLNMRYPVNNPNLMADLNISELRKQLDEIENRALTKDTSRPHKNMHPLDYLPSPKTIVIDSAALAVELVDAVHRAVQETHEGKTCLC